MSDEEDLNITEEERRDAEEQGKGSDVGENEGDEAKPEDEEEVIRIFFIKFNNILKNIFKKLISDHQINH